MVADFLGACRPEKMVAMNKLRVMFYSVMIFRTSNRRDSISSKPERTVLRRQGRSQLYSLQQRTGSLNIKSIFCELKKTEYPKLRNLALFYVWEDARVWAY